MKGKFAICMTAHGTYYFRRLDAPDALGGQVLEIVDDLHQAIKRVFERIGLEVCDKQGAAS